MRHNVLVLLTARLPDRGVELRDLGLADPPASFSDGGRFAGRRAAIRRAARLADEGADIIDVGGESTRPGAAPVRLDEELRRVLPVVEAIAGRARAADGGRVLVSIDTTKAEVVRRAALAGADLINDISGMAFDPGMPA